jgi:hypothetical protein
MVVAAVVEHCLSEDTAEEEMVVAVKDMAAVLEEDLMEEEMMAWAEDLVAKVAEVEEVKDLVEEDTTVTAMLEEEVEDFVGSGEGNRCMGGEYGCGGGPMQGTGGRGGIQCTGGDLGWWITSPKIDCYGVRTKWHVLQVRKRKL